MFRFQTMLTVPLREGKQSCPVNRDTEITEKTECVQAFIQNKLFNYLDFHYFQFGRIKLLKKVVQGVRMGHILFTAPAQLQQILIKKICLPFFKQLPPGFKPEKKHQKTEPGQMSKFISTHFPRPGIGDPAEPFVQQPVRKKMINGEFDLVGVYDPDSFFLLTAARFRFLAF